MSFLIIYLLLSISVCDGYIPVPGSDDEIHIFYPSLSFMIMIILYVIIARIWYLYQEQRLSNSNKDIIISSHELSIKMLNNFIFSIIKDGYDIKNKLQIHDSYKKRHIRNNSY